MRKMLSWIKNGFIETLNQTFTLLGFFIAWIVLEGSAKTVAGIAIIWSFIVWIVTLPIREPDEKEEE